MFNQWPTRLMSLLFVLTLIVGGVGFVAAAGPNVLPGERVHFTSSGFISDEQVDFWITNPQGMSQPRSPAVRADASGSVDWSWDVPLDAPGGQWMAVARGTRSNHHAPAPFTVVAGAAPSRAVRAEPAAGPAGTTFQFTVSGLPPGERFGPWLLGPDGRNYDIDPTSEDIPTLTVDDGGQLRWSWTAPDGSLTGAWRAMARSRTGAAQVEVPFTITGVAPPAVERRVEPAIGAPGTTFTIIVGGLQPDEVAGGWLSDPNGRAVAGTPYFTVDRAGVARWSWTAPAQAQGGRWQAVTRGTESRTEVVLDLYITGPEAVPAPTPAPEGTLRASVAPASGQPGSIFQFSVNGMASNDGELAYWFIDGAGNPVAVLEKIRVDREGRATWTWEVPRIVEPGTWTMTARGRNSYREVSVTFTIDISRTPVVGIEPASAPAGTRFSFLATDFNPYERIDSWAEGPDGRNIHGNLDEILANRQGEARWTWQAPNDMMPGNWIMHVQGRDRQLQLQIPFTITP
ncbi:MAG: hypothetical protein EI684_02265 [Candidatus Viridilinea halotolerans]|uniref:Uncharacterized protein n=1 Tax=Candidatus Viridilinea halotolerans TaxID=2491704 RepID=A0A426U9G4_9CHLR|nr:MAG: hypothetical protein EI684_02265 [Candidatus Viridilinea halotolerans]